MTQYAKDTVKVNGENISIWKISHDVNGNPRYVVHFLSLISCQEADGIEGVGNAYNEAARKIKSIGGRKYRAKWFGGGLVFSSFDVAGDLKHALSA